MGGMHMRLCLLCLAVAVCMLTSVPASAGAINAAAGPYVGSRKCAECHAEEYETFRKYSKKAGTWKHISTMAPKLTAEDLRGCYACHSTGYGKGGFVDYQSTPHLADVGCETCHGPGAAHAESGDPAAIRRTPRHEDCLACHNESRVKAFNFKPLIHSGAH